MVYERVIPYFLSIEDQLEWFTNPSRARAINIRRINKKIIDGYEDVEKLERKKNHRFLTIHYTMCICGVCQNAYEL